MASLADTPHKAETWEASAQGKSKRFLVPKGSTHDHAKSRSFDIHSFARSSPRSKMFHPDHKVKKIGNGNMLEEFESIDENFVRVQPGYAIRRAEHHGAVLDSNGYHYVKNNKVVAYRDSAMRSGKVDDRYYLHKKHVDDKSKIMKEDAEDTFDEQITVQQRLKKSRLMKRLHHRISRMKKMKLKRFATKDQLVKRARREAMKMLKKRFAGERGANYKDLSPADKMNVDRLLDGKKHMVSKIATRVMPAIRNKEQTRMKNMRAQNESYDRYYHRPSTPAEKDKDVGTNKDMEHIEMQLRKSVSLRGQHPVNFADGKSAKVPMGTALKAQAKLVKIKRPAERQAAIRHISQSHDHFTKWIKEDVDTMFEIALDAEQQ